MDKIENRNRLARERERKRVKDICSFCKDFKVCRYSGPTCQNCYTQKVNPSLYQKILKRNKKYSETFLGKFNKLKAQAKYRKKDFDISKEFYQELLQKPCHYCMIPLDGGIWSDRIDNNKGYTEDNVLPCCGSCNHIRNIYLTVEEMKAAMQAVLEYRKQK